MKRLCLCLALFLLLTGCTASWSNKTSEPASSSPTTGPHEGRLIDMVENSAFAGYASEGTLGVVLNEPFDAEPESTVVWMEGEYDRAYIIPRYVGSYVNLFRLLWDEEGNCRLSDQAVQSTCATEGCVIYSVLNRPEGMPQWYLEIEAPNGESSGFVLTYNGNTGTPPEEYFIIGALDELP